MNNSDTSIGIPPLISAEVLHWARMTLVGVLCQTMATFGVTTNIMNMVVYVKLGVKDPMNISLLGLSSSDFFACLSMVWFSICLFPPFMELDLPFQQVGAHYLFGCWPHIVCVKVTTLITAFITIERCLCVTYPLKVKEIITSKRVIIMLVFFYVLNIALAAPVYYVSYHDWVFSEARNRTLYTLVFRENRDEIEPPLFFFIGVFFPFLAFFSIVVATAILVYNLKKNAKWRQEATGASVVAKTKAPDSSDATSSSAASRIQVSSRDTKVAKMVVMISILFLISFCPVMLSSVAMICEPELKEGGAMGNLVHLVFYVNYVLETTNASLNIFIYYNMSTNYKAMFRKMFKLSGHD